MHGYNLLDLKWVAMKPPTSAMSRRKKRFGSVSANNSFGNPRSSVVQANSEARAPTEIPPSHLRAEPSRGADRSRSIAYSGLSGAILRPMKVEEIAEAIAKLPPDQLARFRRWFTAFDAGRTDHAKELDSTATKLGRLAGRAFAELKRRAQE